jgi:hypothetical protein
LGASGCRRKPSERDDLGETDGDATKLIQSQQRSAASGVKIVFSDGNGPKQTLYYFSTNLADGSFQRSGFSAFLARLGPADSLIKSASYLLHNGAFCRRAAAFTQ